MAKATAKRNPTLAAMEPIVLDEMISEGLEPWRKQVDRLRPSEPGSPAHRDALCELWALCDVIEIKAKLAS